MNPSNQGIHTRILRKHTEVQEITSEWREVFCLSGATPFQSPDWLLPWVKVFSPEKMMCVEVRQHGKLVGVAPLLIYQRDGERVLAFMGGGVSDYLDILIDPSLESQAVQAIFSAVLDSGENWSILDLTDLPSHSPLTGIFREYACEHDSCRILRLPGSADELLHCFSKRQRANLRNARSRLLQAGTGVFEKATYDNLSEFLTELFRLHGDRWSQRGQTGVLSDDRVQEFHIAAANGLLAQGLLQLSRLTSQGKTLAVIYSLVGQQTTFCYLQGFDPEFAWLSPGTQLMFFEISDALGRGLRNFDFLRGQEDYKRHWRAERQPTYRIQLPRMQLAALLKEPRQATSVVAA